ncbi:MAG: Stp1/IreP family PP2C-type Ser/Thr phosphatase [Myxococcota bacterium]|nr:Stp1/IreP family PP2C-type Ser/Thr phosphatase [Myxococcota bacterium]
MPTVGLRVAGDSNVGKVRETNEDSLILEPARGLYAVLDGMGGANAGDIASQTARDAIRDFVMQKRLTLPPKQLLEGAILAGSKAVFQSAQANRERHGMGTTCVAVLVVDKSHVIVAHVGDSRCYLLRGGRLQTLTRDHTIVEELVDRGLLSAEEAERHPYKNVLSRNLGSRPDTRVDLVELEFKPGDRLLLCSDGLYGYASAEAIQYILGSGDEPQHVARDLIDLALRGGGGDNVTTIILEAPPAAPTTTQLVRTSGAMAWWQKRQKFLIVAKDRGLTRNPIVRGLDPKDALDVVGLSLCQAVFHDLEKSTGVNVWTFAQNLAGAWFERGGEWAPVRGMMDILGTASRAVVDEIRGADPNLGFLLDVAVSRALVVAELALGGLLAEQLRQIDTDLIQLHAEMQETVEPPDDGLDTGERFIDRPTIPFLRPDRPVTGATMTTEMLDGITKTITIARARTSPRAELVKEVLVALDAIASEGSGNFATAVLSARELYGVRSVDEQGIMPLFDALDQARIIIASSVHQIQTTESNRAKVLRSLSVAHQRLVSAMTGLVLESVAPFSERLREITQVTSDLRDEVAKAERRRAELERKFATNIDASLPWGARGTTEW